MIELISELDLLRSDETLTISRIGLDAIHVKRTRHKDGGSIECGISIDLFALHSCKIDLIAEAICRTRLELSSFPESQESGNSSQ